ncbi:MAG TPA: RluA family pseudouridine synthase [Patescibacteria group bacterium]|nr:RluA family pseudouridine synthase [Patescibacteria group bacterium]
MDFADLDKSILFEDDAIVVINKPAGWVVNRSQTQSELTVQDWFATKIANYQQSTTNNQQTSEYGTPEEIFADRGGIVHRLDKDTSGVLLLAKTPDVLVELLRQFKERETEKTYIALVHGKLVPQEGIIKLPMDRSQNDPKKFAIVADGRESETRYSVVEYFPGLPEGISPKKGKSYQGFSLVECYPKTGRTHQIRVHMAAIKHPLVGDSTYGGRKRITLDQEWCPRHFLHAKKLCFSHPVTNERLCIEAPLPEELQNALNSFSYSL